MNHRHVYDMNSPDRMLTSKGGPAENVSARNIVSMIPST